ncbi:inorganic diphosphatase [Hymenobacter pini]|uniref:inorganic diphosphatase n=1 Tax=Hymenobacter pini TaxID=2880879 RepID=UPI001CF2A7DD|nr:inorganic diphosphatase [Hymenobacter pini]MCA8831405.1 inorganic diphosphatase [Hymenobacter pini]
MRIPQVILPGIFLTTLLGCRTDYADLPTYSAERKLLQVVVEMPAGTNQVQHYNFATHKFEPQQQAGTNELVEFLPLPGNMGFVPGTWVAALAPGTQQPLPALVLSETQPAGSVLEVTPVALLSLDVNGAMQSVLVAVPARPAQRILPDATDWATLNRQYPGVRSSLSLWFQHRTRPAETRIVGWKDEKEAEQYVRNHRQ